MAKKSSCTNINLRKAKNTKDDEFFTKLNDIENELRNYKHHFNGKVVLCNCDESEHTNFYKYFELNFIALNLKKLICVGYRTNRVAEVHVLERVADYRVNEYNIPLRGHGDFRDQESINFLKEADIVVTNPPFSLFREFVAQLVEYDKKFLIIGNKNAISYKEIFPLIKNNKLWLGCTVPTEFTRPDGSIDKLGTLTRWFTNLDTAKRHEILFTGVTYERGMKKGLYQKYDNYDAINVDKVKDIPTDYEGVMGVPITYLDRHNPEQYEIIGLFNNYNKEVCKELDFCICGETQEIPHKSGKSIKFRGPIVNAKAAYARIIIKKL
jgi:hypothetical protein